MELLSFFHDKRKASVRKAKQGDKESFLALLNENKLNLYRVAKGILENKEDIEDVLQNTIIKSYEKIHMLKHEEYFKTWITKILINECNAVIRKSKKITRLDNADKGSYEENHDNLHLNTTVKQLQEDIRIPTVLYYYEDMSIKDISEVLKIPEGTVKSRLSRARQKLRELLSEEE